MHKYVQISPKICTISLFEKILLNVTCKSFIMASWQPDCFRKQEMHSRENPSHSLLVGRKHASKKFNFSMRFATCFPRLKVALVIHQEHYNLSESSFYHTFSKLSKQNGFLTVAQANNIGIFLMLPLIGQQFSKYIQNPTTHHQHTHHSGPSYHHLSPRSL